LLKSFELLVNNNNKDAYAGQLDSFTHLRALLVLHPFLVKFLPLCVTNVTIVTFALFYVTIVLSNVTVVLFLEKIVLFNITIALFYATTVLFYVTIVLSYVPIVVKCF
jgi:hypothetical protein